MAHSGLSCSRFKILISLEKKWLSFLNHLAILL